MEKNSLKYTGLLVFIVWGALLLMQWLPSIAVGEHTLRRVDLLGDVRRPKPVTEEEPDSLLAPASEGEARLCGHLPCGHDVH